MKIPFLDRFIGTTPQPLPSKITYSKSISASHKAQFGQIISAVLQELPELLAVSIIQLSSGELQATHHITGKTDPAKAAGYNAGVIRQNQLAIQALGLTGETIEDMLVTLNNQWHVLRLLPGNRHFIHLMVSMRDTNLGIAREVLRAHTAAPG